MSTDENKKLKDEYPAHHFDPTNFPEPNLGSIPMGSPIIVMAHPDGGKSGFMASQLKYWAEKKGIHIQGLTKSKPLVIERPEGMDEEMRISQEILFRQSARLNVIRGYEQLEQHVKEQNEDESESE